MRNYSNNFWSSLGYFSQRHSTPRVLWTFLIWFHLGGFSFGKWIEIATVLAIMKASKSNPPSFCLLGGANHRQQTQMEGNPSAGTSGNPALCLAGICSSLECRNGSWAPWWSRPSRTEAMGIVVVPKFELHSSLRNHCHRREFSLDLAWCLSKIQVLQFWRRTGWSLSAAISDFPS